MAGALPESATRLAVAGLEIPAGARVWIIALGKAAVAMSAGAAAGLAQRGLELAGGVVVGPASAPPPHPRLRVFEGDHPVPGARSLAAAAAIGELASGVRPPDHVLVLVSGGGTSLVAAPAPDVGGRPGAEPFGQHDLAELYAALLSSGADIIAMNAVRKRFAQWSGGRLAVALAPASVHCLIVSDVLGDDVASISSGPCVSDPTVAPALVATLHANGLWSRLPARAQEYLAAAAHGDAPETPKPHEAAFQHVTVRVIVSNTHALEAAAERARAAGIGEVTVVPTPLSGEAAIAGVRLASEIIARRKRARGPSISRCVIWGGETTVTFAAGGPPPPHVLGGRNQELALAAARSLADAGDAARGIAILAAGTDGRDGPTDAAGAVVDGATWPMVAGAGRDPEVDLASHDAYHALDAAGALLRTGLTGTNVMDVVIGLVL